MYVKMNGINKKTLVIEFTDHDLRELSERIKTRIYESSMTDYKITEVELPNLPSLFGVDISFAKRSES